MKRDNSGIYKLFPADEAGVMNVYYNSVLDYAEKNRALRHELTFSLSVKDGQVVRPEMHLYIVFPDASVMNHLLFDGGKLHDLYHTYTDVQEAINDATLRIDENITIGAWDEDEAMGNF